ncbi:SDR family NAD(P)-dependent oxidoreductase [Ruminiclostridium josui]|uniref:SDR family NAD(P)-dependent oxidoreductase n=1 Tax=Ruminiclostridium josui TaxID=1499 RepID=UPI00046636D8|nr:SDR family oxidoreductase [Ruminiclostridium josui]
MDKKIALVTGGNKGIGAAICRKLASDGCYVCINSRNKENARDLLDDIVASGGVGEIIEFDVRSPQEEIQKALNNFPFQRLDILVNNAGTLKDNLIYEVSNEDWNQVLDTNYFGALAVHSACLSRLRLSPNATVVNLCSISGVKPRKGQLPYAVSKAMLIEWTKQMGLRNRKNDISYYAVSPGPVATDLIKSSPWYNDPKSTQRIPLGRYAEVEEIAEFISYLAEGNHVFENGSNIILDGGFTQTVKET